MEHSPPSWELNSHSFSQKIPSLLWDRKFHYRAHKSLPVVAILSQMHPGHTFLYYFLQIHSNIILSSTPSSSNWSLSFRFSDQNIVYISHLSLPISFSLT